MLDHFSWGDAFFEVNRELLDIYAACSDADDIGVKQQQWMDKLEQEYQDRRTEETTNDDMWTNGNINHEPQGDLPPSDDENPDNDDHLWTTDRLGNRIRKE